MSKSSAQVMSRPGRKQTAIGRSLDVYYRDKARTAQMDALNAAFVRKGSLVFDIGAHVGDRTGSFLRLGADVVALEPQPSVFRALRLIYGRSERVMLHQAAVGAREGDLRLQVNSANPTISTASSELIAAARTAEEWQGQVWDDTIEVPMTTLDALIDRHGLPDFVKIDVEGYELEVLNGLSTSLPALSFEFTIIQRDLAYACLSRLDTLATYQFNFSLGEEHCMALPDWVDGEELKADLARLPMSANSGDVFARRT
ncbi:FkbM family methyltransferase [Aestuariibius sp. 2305UL40-4]|uniref:FkbM family methyltransferase n=1 Tax=Aestuariibius violaceus TaxID=3234132 RepID=UPI00345E53B8